MIGVIRAIWPTRLNLLIRINFCSTAIPEQLPAYKILLRNSVENQIKIPSQLLLKNIRSRGILRVMISNHTISDQSKVLETHIQCLYALVQRSQPTIEAISMFNQKVMIEVNNFKIGETTPSFLNLFNEGVLSKLCKIVQSVDSYYNETFRTLVCTLIFKLLFNSNGSSRFYKTKMRIMLTAVKQCQNQKKSLVEENGNIIHYSQLQEYKKRKEKQFSLEHRRLAMYDYWCGFRTLINLDYYQEELLTLTLQSLKYEAQKHFRTLKINEIMNFIQIIYDLQKFKELNKVNEESINNLNQLYNRLVDQYFKMLSNQQILFELVNSESYIIQSHLITQFLSIQHFEKAKQVYFNIFKMTLNSIENGGLLIDIRRLRGFFQVVLIMFSHEDTKNVHQLLRQLQKIMILYPLQRFKKLETHSILCEKYGYRSEIIAQQYFHYLLYQKQKNDRFKGHLHVLQHCTRQIILAKKFHIYLSITNNTNTQKAQLVSKIINTYFERSIWPFLESGSIEGFLDATGFYNYVYYQKYAAATLTTGTHERKKIEFLAQRLGLKNINSAYGQVLENCRMNIHRFSLKTSYSTQWKDNSHARMMTILQLAAFNYEYLKKTDLTAADNFIQQFMSKTISSPQFYNIFKQKIAYPGLFKAYSNLMSLLNPQAYTLEFKDLEAIKKIYQNQLNKLLQSPKKPPFQIIYQGYLELVEFNRVLLPYNNDIFSLAYVGHSAYQTEICSVLKMFEKQKQALKLKLETYSKLNKSKEISVIVNFIEYPYFADVKITLKNETIFLIYRSYQGLDAPQPSVKHIQLIGESQSFWRKNGCNVFIIKSEKDIEEFMKKKITKTTFSRP